MMLSGSAPPNKVLGDTRSACRPLSDRLFPMYGCLSALRNCTRVLAAPLELELGAGDGFGLTRELNARANSLIS